MQAHPDWDVLNHGVNGERSDQIRGALRARRRQRGAGGRRDHRRRQRRLPGPDASARHRHSCGRCTTRAAQPASASSPARSFPTTRRPPTERADAADQRVDPRRRRATNRRSRSSTRAPPWRTRRIPIGWSSPPTACIRPRRLPAHGRCHPPCARGRLARYPVEHSLTDRTRCQNHGFYRNASVRRCGHSPLARSCR